MGPPSIVPLISPDLMVKNLPAPPPPPSIHIVSDLHAAMNLNPDVPEFVPRNGPLESKTDENCDTNDQEQIKTTIDKSTNSDVHNVTSETTSQNIKFGKIINHFYFLNGILFII